MRNPRLMDSADSDSEDEHGNYAYRDENGSGAKVFLTFVLPFVFPCVMKPNVQALLACWKVNRVKTKEKDQQTQQAFFSKRKPLFWHVQKRGRDGRAPFLSWISTPVDSGLHESLRPHLHDATASPQCPCVGELKEFSCWSTAKSSIQLYIWKLASKEFKRCRISWHIGTPTSTSRRTAFINRTWRVAFGYTSTADYRPGARNYVSPGAARWRKMWWWCWWDVPVRVLLFGSAFPVWQVVQKFLGWFSPMLVKVDGTIEPLKWQTDFVGYHDFLSVSLSLLASGAGAGQVLESEQGAFWLIGRSYYPSIDPSLFPQNSVRIQELGTWKSWNEDMQCNTSTHATFQ